MKIIALQTNIHISCPAKVLEFSNSWKKNKYLEEVNIIKSQNCVLAYQL